MRFDWKRIADDDRAFWTAFAVLTSAFVIAGLWLLGRPL